MFVKIISANRFSSLYPFLFSCFLFFLGGQMPVRAQHNANRLPKSITAKTITSNNHSFKGFIIGKTTTRENLSKLKVFLQNHYKVDFSFHDLTYNPKDEITHIRLMATIVYGTFTKAFSSAKTPIKNIGVLVNKKQVFFIKNYSPGHPKVLASHISKQSVSSSFAPNWKRASKQHGFPVHLADSSRSPANFTLFKHMMKKNSKNKDSLPDQVKALLDSLNHTKSKTTKASSSTSRTIPRDSLASKKIKMEKAFSKNSINQQEKRHLSQKDSIRIDKNSTNKQLHAYQKLLAKKSITLHYQSPKRNKKGKIIQLIISLDNQQGTHVKNRQKTGKGIAPLIISYDNQGHVSIHMK